MTDVPPPPPPVSSSGYGGAGQPALPNPLISYWKKVVLENYANFEGRARRSEFWWYELATLIAVFVLVLLITFADIFWVLYVLYLLAIIVPTIAVTIRRLHDSDKSGWWILIGLIPFGGLVVLVFMCLDSTRGANRWGISPKYP
jgi:uncharacterized membrane protein YhaH (DUF805 family)